MTKENPRREAHPGKGAAGLADGATPTATVHVGRQADKTLAWEGPHAAQKTSPELGGMGGETQIGQEQG